MVLQILDLQLMDLVSNGSTNAGWPRKKENGGGQISYNPATLTLSPSIPTILEDAFYTIILNIGSRIIKASQLGPFKINVSKQSWRQDASSDMAYAIIITKVLQSVEEEDELVKDEDATEHEIVQDNKKKVQTNDSGWASQGFSST